MKRVVDELIGLGSVLSAYADTGIWPKRVHPDSIGQLLDCEELCSIEPYSGHKDLLVALNDVHNAQKHSFLNSDTTLVGRDEPIASAIHRKGNKIDAPLEVYTLSVKDLAARFESFGAAILKVIKELADQARRFEKESKNISECKE